MSKNIEIKAAVHGPETLISHINSLPISTTAEFFQHDTFFHVPYGRLKVRRQEGKMAEVIYYVRENQAGPKSSYYIRIHLSDQFQRIFRPIAKLWPRRGDVHKKRHLFIFDKTRIHLDQVEGLGWYLEFEVLLDKNQTSEDGQEIATYLLRTLQVDESDLISEAYIDLLSSKEFNIQNKSN
uniref:Adenylate cyclase n=1 Tax=Candidatus Nitrotoga fabula TaxID=2182327 RepID=A0A2X0SCX0_9PROT|nr:Adenylate cyclase [Candidatus Nitrotoga fabula]